ncbi:MAG: sigma-70 family RNA polymerase sigma factor, partial [Deltaproteobacteria bacterium]|nr:sigma-70 family RNA polymerase sigma factor [Deltaproteobacteria bacterium]
PSDEESAEAMGVELHAYHKALDEISVINMLDLEAFRIEGSGGGRESLDLYEVLQDENSQDALTVLGQEELRQVLAEAIDALPEKEKLVVTLYYHEELTMKEIGQVMGYTESRISQIHTKSVVRLRGRLSRYFEHRGRGVLKAGAAKETKGAKRGPKKREPQPAEPGPGAVAAPENAVPGPAASAAAGASAVVAASDAAGDSAGAGVSAGTGDSAGAGVSAGTGDSAGVAVSAGTAFQPVASHESPAPEPAVSGSPEGRWVSVGIPDEGAVPSADAVPPSSGPDAPQSGPGLEAALAAPEMSSASGLPGAEPFAPAAFAGGASPEGEVLSEPAAPADIAAGTDIASPAYIAVQADIASPTEAGEDAACSQSFEPPREPSSELPRETFSEPQPEQSPEPSADLSAASPVSADAAVPEDHAEAAVPASPSAETPETHAAADGPEVTDTGGALAAPGAAGAPDAENGPDDAERLGEGASVTAAASAPSATSQPFAGGFGGDGRDGGGA